jgi:hypothetical protein
MKFSNVLIIAGLAVAATGGAFAETGVNTADLGSVANVYGRASSPTVEISGPVVIRPADVNVAGREPVQGTTPMVVTTKESDVNEIFGRA